MRPLVYIDGKEGTTGLQIYDRLAGREDIQLLLIDEEKRKDVEERRRLMNQADLVFLCLPDQAACEAFPLSQTITQGSLMPPPPTEPPRAGSTASQSWGAASGRPSPRPNGWPTLGAMPPGSSPWFGLGGAGHPAGGRGPHGPRPLRLYRRREEDHRPV